MSFYNTKTLEELSIDADVGGNSGTLFDSSLAPPLNPMSSSFTVSTRLASLFKRLNDLNERLDLSSAPTGKRTRSRGTRPIADLEWGNSMRREFEDFTKILKTRTKDLEGVLQVRSRI